MQINKMIKKKSEEEKKIIKETKKASGEACFFYGNGLPVVKLHYV